MQRTLNLLQVLSKLIPFFYEKAVFQIPVMRPASDFTNNYQVMEGWGPASYLRHWS